MTRVEAVVFDLDGTLVDHASAVTNALDQWLPTLGVPATSDLVTAWLAAEDRHFPAWRTGEISFAEQRRRRLRDFLPLVGVDAGDDAPLDAVFTGYLRHYEASWTCFDDVEPLLQALADLPVRTAVLTNGTEEQQHAKLEAVGLAGRLGPVFSAEGIGAAKPDLSTYRTVCAALAVNPEHALHVGDQYELDVLAPRRAGMRAVHLDRENTGPDDETVRIRSLRELPGPLGHPTGN